MYKLGENFADIYFTKREDECIVYLLKGKTIKTTAQVLDLSPRTVEFYVQNMKHKLGCHSKSRLLELVCESDLLSNIDF